MTSFEMLMPVCLLRLANPERHGNDASNFERLRSVSFNTGNLCFFEGLRRSVVCDREVDYSEDLRNADETIVTCLANFIRPNADLEFELQHLRQSGSKHVVLVGVGAQADTYQDCFQLSESLREFLAFVADRSATIGVRGSYTAELLARNGFKATHIIGCPSAFINGRTKPAFSTSLVGHIGVSATPVLTNRHLTRKLYNIGIRQQAPYFLQGEIEFVTFQDRTAIRQDLLEERERTLRLNTPPGYDESAILAWIKSKSCIYFDFAEWQRALQSVDLLVGTRIHGAIMALNSGVRTALVPCDARTSEMAAFLNIPCISPDGLERMGKGDFSETFFPHNYLTTYSDRLSNYLEFLRSNELPSRIESVTQQTSSETWSTTAEGRAGRTIEAAVVAREAKQIQRDKTEIVGFDEHAAVASLQASHVTMDANASAFLRNKAPKLTISKPVAFVRQQLPVETESPEVLREGIERYVVGLSMYLDRYVARTFDNPYFILGEPPVEIENAKLNAAKLHSSRLNMLTSLGGNNVAVLLPADMGLLITLLEVDDDLSISLIGEEFDCLKELPAGRDWRLRHIEGNWQDVLPQLGEDSFDRIVFESPLTQPLTMEFLKISKKLVKLGGHIVIGNYATWSIFEGRAYGVVQAVNEFVNTENFSVSNFVVQRYGYNTITLRRN